MSDKRSKARPLHLDKGHYLPGACPEIPGQSLGAGRPQARPAAAPSHHPEKPPSLWTVRDTLHCASEGGGQLSPGWGRCCPRPSGKSLPVTLSLRGSLDGPPAPAPRALSVPCCSVFGRWRVGSFWPSPSCPSHCHCPHLPPPPPRPSPPLSFCSCPGPPPLHHLHPLPLSFLVPRLPLQRESCLLNR